MPDPLTVACAACAQQPAEPCVDRTNLTHPVTLAYIHAERSIAANSDDTQPISDEVIDATGLI